MKNKIKVVLWNWTNMSQMEILFMNSIEFNIFNVNYEKLL